MRSSRFSNRTDHNVQLILKWSIYIKLSIEKEQINATHQIDWTRVSLDLHAC